MKEKLYLIFTEGGYIGTVTWIEDSNFIFACADIYGVFNDGTNTYLETEVHYKLKFNNSSDEDIVLNGILSKIIPSYEANGYTYHWRDITPSNYDSHPIL
jgi:hypothetical protein